MLTERPNRVQQAMAEFLGTRTPELLKAHAAGDPTAAILELFRTVAARVPAYGNFLRERGVEVEAIRTFADFQTLPLVTKENYLLRHPLADLCRDGRLEACDLVAVSSGSTGKPIFWPRALEDELQIAARFEQIFRDSFQADRRRTLAVVCFTLGTWVGGIYTANCCRHLATKGYPLTVVAPGSNKDEIFRVVVDLGPAFDQVVLLGYPPFLKDVIDSGLPRGVPWPRYHLRLVMAGEVFSEEWRSLVGERMGSDNPNFDSASLYGTADAGVLGNETPLSICIRRFLAERPEAARALFGESRLPTLVQYDPFSRYFETIDGTLLFSGDNGVPLVRYHISDNGGTVPYPQLLGFLRDHGFDPLAELAPHHDRGVYALPFAYVFGRSHFTISYFGANIYPENVTVGLEQPEIEEWVTGKFVMQAREDADRNRFLSVVVELAPGVAASEDKADAIATSILHHLRRLNSEFANYVPPEYQSPRIELRPLGDTAYFPLGVKHRYTRQ
jgi:phenylacetate-CoA ligase